MNNLKMKKGRSVITYIMLVILAAYAIALIGVLLWAIMTSFKSLDDFRANPTFLPKVFSWNYGIVYNAYSIQVLFNDELYYVGMLEMYFNSVAYALGGAFFQTMVTCITAYVCARYPFRFSKALHSIVIVTMIIPVVGNLVSEIQVATALGLTYHIWGTWIMKANFMGLYFLVFYEFSKSLSPSYFEAARIDGANDWHILLRIALPLLRNLILTVMLINFIAYWNDYQIPLIYIPNKPTISYGMYYFSFGRSDNELAGVPMYMAAAILVVVPVIAVFLCFHKKLLGNLTVGGVK
ncbi:MAG: carbohydrate ABC transporter permease [Clostridia bacterium]|nr:carbohydrate ABC transporter permease [Clostridia bacterium]